MAGQIDLRRALTDPRFQRSQALDPRTMLAQTMLRQRRAPRTPLAGLGTLAQQLSGAYLLSQARRDAETAQEKQGGAQGELLQALLAGGSGAFQDLTAPGGSLADALKSSGPEFRQGLFNTQFAAQQGLRAAAARRSDLELATLRQRKTKRQALEDTSEQRRTDLESGLTADVAKAKRGPKDLSPRDKAFSLLTPEQQKAVVMAKGLGQTITFNSDGSVEIKQGGAVLATSEQPTDKTPVASLLKPKEALKQSEQFSFLTNSIDLLDNLIEEIQQNPDAFGVSGSIGRTLQTAKGVAGDILDVGGAVETAKEFLRGTTLEGFIDQDFDPQLPRTQLLEHSLAAALAKVRSQKGGEEGRALTQLYVDAKKDVKLTGLTSSRAVQERLIEIRDEFKREQTGLGKRLSTTAPVSGDRPSASSTKTEQDRLLRQARRALRAGKQRSEVERILQEHGIDPGQL